MTELPLQAIKDKTSIGEFDATITELNRLVFGHSLGFGEAKIAQSTPDKYNFCHDLLRLTLFCKETIDKKQLNASLAFQINGFPMVFYLIQLNHDGIYWFYEICKLSFSGRIV
ncbi:hypothetical protein BY458DRAFT_489919 [Sporodiniella umbellata]|nr:hypothetical protein BY458DRAFT_489919 [Sporodiniella umbellata]